MTECSVIVRADARREAGGGHMSRCLNLAQALRPDCDVAFVLGADAAPHWQARVREAGFDVVGSTLSSEADVVVLDGYDLTIRDVADWRRQCRTLVMLEDLGRGFTGVDLSICYGGPPPQAVRALVGPRYALLEASYARPVAIPGDGVLVACGLRDSANATGRYLDALARGGIRESITVVLGGAASHREEVERQARALGAHLVFDAPDMVSLYDSAAIVLGAGGVSLFERAARGRASVTVVAADNQRHSVAELAGIGGAQFAGDLRTIDPQALMAAVEKLLTDRDARAAMATRSRQAVDGLGAKRAAREILALAAGAMECASVAADR